MAKTLINQKVLMSGADYFKVVEINAYESSTNQPNKEQAILEHQKINQILTSIGVEVVKIAPPENCQDGVYTANWGLVIDQKIVLSQLPNLRQNEEQYAYNYFSTLSNYEIIKPPFKFSGQGDALVCGDYIFVGSSYRTDKRMWSFLEQTYNRQVIGLQTIPARDNQGQPIINKLTGWPDSYFYDLDLALAVINPTLIAWCPEAFDLPSQQLINSLEIDKIEVDYQEAINGLACNLISTAQDVIMSNNAPKLQAELERRGLKVQTPVINELKKGGGYIRCISLTL